MRIIVRLLIVSLLAAATSLQAITYIVPNDRDLVKRAEAIVIATAVESRSQFTTDGRIVTIATLAVDEVLKGEFADQSSIDLTELGGFVGERGAFFPGSPRYAPGKRYMVFLRRTPDGWATYGFGLGKFEYISDRYGNQVLVRGGLIEGIFGWNEVSNTPHVEGSRDATAFKTFVETLSASPGAPARDQYFISQDEAAAQSSLYSPKPMLSVPGGLNGTTAMAAGAGNWSSAGAGVNYTVGASNPNAAGGFSPDGINAVLFNDPCGIVPQGVAALGGFSAISGSYKISPDNVTTYGSPTEVDVVVGKNFSANQATFNGLMTHEMGHTLGFRHSDKTADDSGACVSPSPCSTNAIMNSFIASNLQSLQQWDLDAVQTVYGNHAGTRSDYLFPGNPRWQSPSVRFDYCFGATITSQPSNVTIAPGAQTTLNVGATGTNATYQWYVGNPPNTATMAPNGTTSSLTVSPTATTTYWVQVRACPSSCISPVNSNGATVTVAVCVPPSAPTPNASPSSIPSGQSSTLSVSATGTGPFTYQWFVGNSGETTTPINGATGSFTTVSPTTNTSYWVRVTGQCMPVSDSSATTVTVTCSPISTGPNAQPSTINSGGSSTLSFATNGSVPFTIQWYVGSVGDTANPIQGATGTSIQVTPAASTAYWVHVTAPCGSQDGSVIVFVAGTPCTAPSISTQPTGSTISVGSPVTLAVAVAGTAPLTFQWFVGEKSDTSSPIVGATTSSLTRSPTTTTKYWVRVSNSCNGTQSADSNAATVTVLTCTSPSITTQPANVSAAIGTAATVKVVAAGNSLHYQWFQGVKGDTSKPVGSDSATLVTSAISSSTSFWVRVTGACGSPADGNAAIVTAIAAPRGRAAKH